MISMEELLSGQCELKDLSVDQQTNINDLLVKVNKVREKYGKAMTVTSGYRTMKHHLEIYKAKGKVPPNVPMKSNHLYGRACDISDPKQTLQKWCKENVKFLEEVGLWMEDFSETKTWVHFQINPPRSGNRFYMP